MSFAAGQALAYLKIGVLALAVMAVVWAVVRVVEARGRGKNDGGDGRDGCRGRLGMGATPASRSIPDHTRFGLRLGVFSKEGRISGSKDLICACATP